MISKEVLPIMIANAENKLANQFSKLRKTLLEYAKRRDINNSGRKYFYIAIEEMDLKISPVNDKIDDDNQIDGEIQDEDGHERTVQDEIFNHVMVEEGYNAHSPLEDLIKHNGKHQITNDEEDDEEGCDEEDDEEDEERVIYDTDDLEDLEDPYEGLSEEEVMARMPPYFNKSFKQKKKFFTKLNQKYISSLRNPKKNGANDNKPKVNFDLKKNSIKKFKKQQKVRE